MYVLLKQIPTTVFQKLFPSANDLYRSSNDFKSHLKENNTVQ